jgi:threonine-phosphate decarboxylase
VDEAAMTAVHGGDVWQIAQEFGIAVEQILDFSANINPRGLPAAAHARLQRDAADPGLLRCYPDRSARRLREALSTKLDVPFESIVIGPGAEALLAPILRNANAKRAWVPIPAFSEYRRVCEQQEVEFAPVPFDGFRDHVQLERGDLVFVNNPHNPTGALMDAWEVRALAERTRTAGATLLVDEAFIDYTPHASVVKEAAANSGLIVLRSLTKFYSCPALRVGYAVANPETAAGMASYLPAWPVTQLALDALTEAVADHDFTAESLRDNERDRESLAAALRALGLTVRPSAANFLFMELNANMPTSSELRARLIARHGILIRNCDSYDGLAPGRFVRAAVRSAEDNRRLAEAFATELLV